MKKINIAILVSGRGTNMTAIIEAIESGELNAEIACVISNVPDVPALEKAAKHNIKTMVINYKDFNAREVYEDKLIDTLRNYDIDLICLAGYMRVLGKKIVDLYRGRIMNIHPALLPSFPGLQAQWQAFLYGVKVTGSTVHFVDEGCDSGPIILQKAVEVLEDDTVFTMDERILKAGHKLYVEAIKLFSEGRLKIEGRKVHILRGDS